MKIFYHYLTIFFLLILSLNVYAGGEITGPSSACPNATVRYNYKDGNSTCKDIEWEVYENGVKKTSGFVISKDNDYIDVTWSASGTGEVKARGYDQDPYLLGCFSNYQQDWQPIKTTLLDGTPNVASGNVLFCNNGSTRTRTWRVSPTCPTNSYTWEVPTGWSLNGGGSRLTTSSTSVNITAPTTGSGSFNIRVRANVTNQPSSSWRNRQVHLGKPTNGYIDESTGNLNLCPNQSYYLIATASPGTTFSNWKFSGALTGHGSGSTANITTYSNYNGGQVSVMMSNECGETSEASQTFRVGYNCGYYLTAEEVNVYPNPANDTDVTVEWPELAEVCSVELMDDKGRIIEISTPKKNKAKFKVQKLKKGNYSVHVLTEEGTIKKRIIKE